MTQLVLAPQTGRVDAFLDDRADDDESREGRLRSLVAIPNLGLVVGILTVSLGAVLVAVAWGKIAGLPDVGHQLPYLMVPGLPGVGAVVVGLMVISTASRRADAGERRRQLGELNTILRTLQKAMEEDR